MAVEKVIEIFTIKSIYKWYWPGEVKSSIENYVEGLQSEIACVGFSIWNRNKCRILWMGPTNSDSFSVPLSAICHFQMYFYEGRTHKRVDSQVFSSSNCAKLHTKKIRRIHFTNFCGGVVGGYKSQFSGNGWNVFILLL